MVLAMNRIAIERDMSIINQIIAVTGLETAVAGVEIATFVKKRWLIELEEGEDFGHLFTATEEMEEGGT